MQCMDGAASGAHLSVLASLLQATVGDAAATGLAPLFSRCGLDRNQALLAQGQRWDDAVLIESGLLRLFFLRPDGREFNKNFYAEGALLCPLTPAMWGEPSLFSIAAVEATTVWRAPAGRLREALAARGQWEPLRTALLDRLITHKLQRESDLLTLDGRRRYQAFGRRYPALAARVPLVHLASYLGLTDVSLSRIRRGLKAVALNKGSD